MTPRSQPARRWTGQQLGPSGPRLRARFALTDRSGIRVDPNRGDSAPNSVPVGASAPPYDAFNLALHVEDRPEAVHANRAALAAALGATPEQLRTMEQVHGAEVAHVGAQLAGTPVADALLSTTPGVLLAVQVADCVPIGLADPVAGAVAVVHAGRRGVAADIVAATVAELRRTVAGTGNRSGELFAVIGPSICGCCYEVPAAMHDELVARVPAAAARSWTGTPALDLPAAVAAQLRAAGVGSVEVLDGRTAEESELYSYRRDGRTGRFALVAWLEEV